MSKDFSIIPELIEISKNSPVLRKHIIYALADDESYSKAIDTYEEFLSIIEYDLVIARAFIFALEKHEGQYYQWKEGKKLPYAYHLCKCVINADLLGSKGAQNIIALWHDIIEDKKATRNEIIRELKNKIYSGINKESIIDALFLLDKNNANSIKEYFCSILKNKDASLIKSADIISNLDECINRFKEIINTDQRFWIYNYLIEIPNFFLNSEEFNNNYLIHIKRKILAQLSSLSSSLSKNNLKEFEKYSKEVNKK